MASAVVLGLLGFLQKTHTPSRRKRGDSQVMGATHVGWDPSAAQKLGDSSFYCWAPHSKSLGNVQVIIINICRSAGNGTK